MEKKFLNLKIAVDFDGTIVEHAYPKVGAEKLFAIDTLRIMQEHGCQLILWTFRTGPELEEAIDFCRKRDLEFYAINKNYPEEVFDDSISRKINADIYIDDKNIGGLPDWGSIWQMLDPEGYYKNADKIEKYYFRSKFNMLFGKKRK